MYSTVCWQTAATVDVNLNNIIIKCSNWAAEKLCFCIRWGGEMFSQMFTLNTNKKKINQMREMPDTWSKPWDARLQRFKIKCKSYSFSKVLVIFTLTHKVLRRKETTECTHQPHAWKCSWMYFHLLFSFNNNLCLLEQHCGTTLTLCI